MIKKQIPPIEVPGNVSNFESFKKNKIKFKQNLEPFIGIGTFVCSLDTDLLLICINDFWYSFHFCHLSC